jgi:hypothetical protein
MKLRQGPTFVRTSGMRLPDRNVDLGWSDDRPKIFSVEAEALEEGLEVLVETFDLVNPGENVLAFWRPVEVLFKS